MQIIGLTGGIGSGKSTIARELAHRGYAVYDCDSEAKRIIAEDTDVRAAIISLIGENAFVNGRYNTAYVSRAVFAEPSLLKGLNAIVHPAVYQDILRKKNCLAEEAGGEDYFFVESAILYESGLDALCDRIVMVDAPEDIRLARTIARDYNEQATTETIAMVRARMRAQAVTRGYKETKRPIVVVNDGRFSVPELAKHIIGTIAAGK